MITNYIPNTCKYSVNNLKKVVHIFSESENVIHIDNGEAYVTSGITDFQTIYATSVDFAESTSYDDRFKFEKQITVTVDGFLKFDSLNEKYYVVLEDENKVMWLVNADFPSFVTYSYTLADGTDEAVLTFNTLSNFPTLRFTNLSLTYSHICETYKFPRIGTLMIAEKDNAVRNAYKFVNFNEGSLKVEESYDGTNVTTNIQFDINFNDYQSSWHYNLLEYPDNKYVVKVGNLTCGLEMGLVPSYSAQGSHQMNTGDKVTITLTGTSLRGSEYSEITTDYIWVLTDDWTCYTPPVPPVPTGPKYTLTLQDSSTVSAECDSTLSVTQSEIGTRYSGSVVSAVIGDCVTSIDYSTFEECTKLTSCTIGNSVTSISTWAFSNCKSLTSVILPSGLTSIGDAAFASCNNLTSINIPNSVTNIGGSAFLGCGLTNVTIPSGVTRLEYRTFFGCGSLTSVTVLATTPPTLGGSVFYATSSSLVIYVPSTSVDTYKSAWSGWADRIQPIP